MPLNKKLIILITILFIGSLAISAVSATENLTEAVGVEDMSSDALIEEFASDDNSQLAFSNNDIPVGDDYSPTKHNVSGTTFRDIQDVIDSAKDGDSIELSGNYFGNGSSIIINKRLNITGNGQTVLDAGNSSGIFKVNLHNVTITNLKFINANNYRAVDGFANGSWTKYEFQCINCTFDNNLQGAISGGTSINCTFINNNYFYTVEYNLVLGGAMYHGKAFNCIFINNTCDGWGGAMDYSDAFNCTFINNSANRAGGAICGGNAYGCTFINNSADEDSGAMSSSYAVNCTFINNSAKNGGAIGFSDAMNCTFEGNLAGENGGAFYGYGNVVNCKFNGNLAGRNGGAIYYSGLPEDDAGIGYRAEDRCATNCIFTQNYAFGDGGAIYNGVAINCSIFNNSYLQTYETILRNTSVIDYGVLQVSQSALNYYKEKKLTVKFLSYYGEGIPNANILIKFSNGKQVKLTTNYKGVATYSIPFGIGVYSAEVSVLDNATADSVNVKSIKIVKAPVKIIPKKLSTTYGSGKYFQVKVVNSKTNNPISGVKLSLKVYTGKKYKTVTITTNSKGIAKYSASTLKVGSHKIVASLKNKKLFSGKAKTSSIKVSKAKITISAPKSVSVYKSGTFKVTVKNKNTGKAMKGIKVTLKVFTGKKYRTYNVKTNSKGVASVSTKSLSVTTHKVLVNVKGTSNVKKASAKSSVKVIKQKTPTSIRNSSIVYKYLDDKRIGVSGVFGVYANNKLLNNADIDLYLANGIYLKTISSGSQSFISFTMGNIKLKFDGDAYYSPSSYIIKI